MKFSRVTILHWSNFPFHIGYCTGLTTVQRYCAACDIIDDIILLLWWGCRRHNKSIPGGVNTEEQTGDVPAAKQVVQVSDVVFRQID